MIKAVLFDFNGTLYFDNDINYRAWERIFYELTSNSYNFPKEYGKYRTLGNFAFIEHIYDMMNINYTVEDIKMVSLKKEMYYQKISINEKRTVLASGVVDILNNLKENNIKMNIATRSIKENVDFYFKYFDLSNWFNIDNVVYSGGNINKGEMFKEAAEKMDVNLDECVIFEDSKEAIKETLEYGAKVAVYINVDGDKYLNDNRVISISEYNELHKYLKK